ncbi:MAG: MoxR family ATPase, partial [Proteobacteria bacterium]|nr:MoxR family ATPase [Pseudomonadota bacterium]
NPIEQEGTYPLPEAQLDRFLLHVRIDYPRAGDEQAILALAREEALQGRIVGETGDLIEQAQVFAARQEILKMYMSDELERYLLELVLATRSAGAYGDDLRDWIQYGASPRASIALDRCSRAHAWLAERDYVAPEDIQLLAHDVLRHRIILNYAAEAEGISTDHVINELIARIAVP